MKKIRVFEAFSGIGAQREALKNANINFEIVGTSDWFINAILAYDVIHCYNEKIEVPSYEEQIKYLEKFTFRNDSVKTIKSLKSLKKEEIYTTTYKDFKEAQLAIFAYIEGWYNRKRIHSAINYMTPNQCEALARNIA